MLARTWIVGAALVLGSLASPQEVFGQSAGRWDVVLNGHAVHLNASRSWNENNWGLGLEREFPSRGRWVKLAMANGFEDSQGHVSYMAGGGLKRRFDLGPGAFYVDVGAVGFLMTRDDVEASRPFPGVLPAATFGFKRVAINLTYLPPPAVDRVTIGRSLDPTLDGVFFLQLKLDASLFGLGTRSRPRPLLAEETSAP